MSALTYPVAALAVSLLTALSCSTQEDEPILGADQPLGPISDGMRGLAAAEMGLALDLHRELASLEGAGNVVISPHSIWRALGMTREGAGGATRTEFDDLLGLSTLPKPHLAKHEIKALGLHLDRAVGKEIELKVADMVWVREGLDVSDETGRDIRFAYGAEVQPMDFRGDPAKALSSINGWIAEHTGGKIESMLDGDAINGDTELALTNALYFKAPWKVPFEPKLTRPRSFTRGDGKAVEVPFMHLPAAESFPMGQLVDADAGVSATVVEIPYEGKAFSLCLMIPDSEDGLGNLESWLTEERLRAGLASLEPRKIKVALPKLTLEPRMELVNALKSLGLRSAFDAQAADFTGFSRDVPLVVSSVDHAVFLELSEEGTEAAAATVVTLKRGSAPREIAADRPFLFLLRENETGAPLLFGRITDPSE